MPGYNGDLVEDNNFYQESDQPQTWYFNGGDWCVTLRDVTEIEDREMAKQVIASGLVSFL